MVIGMITEYWIFFKLSAANITGVNNIFISMFARKMCIKLYPVLENKGTICAWNTAQLFYVAFTFIESSHQWWLFVSIMTEMLFEMLFSIFSTRNVFVTNWAKIYRSWVQIYVIFATFEWINLIVAGLTFKRWHVSVVVNNLMQLKLLLWCKSKNIKENLVILFNIIL